jgi:hypothetical protein
MFVTVPLVYGEAYAAPAKEPGVTVNNGDPYTPGPVTTCTLETTRCDESEEAIGITNPDGSVTYTDGESIIIYWTVTVTTVANGTTTTMTYMSQSLVADTCNHALDSGNWMVGQTVQITIGNKPVQCPITSSSIG